MRCECRVRVSGREKAGSNEGKEGEGKRRDARELLRSPRHLLLAPCADGAPRGVRDGDEEVGGGLAVLGGVAHVGEVLARGGRGAEEREVPLVDDAYLRAERAESRCVSWSLNKKKRKRGGAHLIKMLVQRLAGLVERDDGGLVRDVGRDAQGLDELERGGRAGGQGQRVRARVSERIRMRIRRRGTDMETGHVIVIVIGICGVDASIQARLTHGPSATRVHSTIHVSLQAHRLAPQWSEEGNPTPHHANQKK